MSTYFQATDPDIWTGRSTASVEDRLYWYQNILCQKTKVLSMVPLEAASAVGLIGYACDEGVRRNQGRVGARQGPDAIRRQLAKLAWHHGAIRPIDYGNVLCPDEAMETCQQQLGQLVAALLQNKVFPIVLGGGHDVAYGHYLGLRKHLSADTRLGIINFDAHFDLRPPVAGGNSGTPFHQILHEHPFQQCNYMVLGLQAAANTQSLFEVATAQAVGHVTAAHCQWWHLDALRQQLTEFAEQQDALYISIDLDGFASAYAPGVSAPSPVGMEPNLVMELLATLFKSGKVISCDLAEMNPTFDVDGSTARLAARLVDHIVSLL
ncbi:MAG: formimidoylglutamase [Bacteroidota bacterium]